MAARLGLRHIAGFFVISGAIFTIGLQSGKTDRSERRLPTPAPLPAVKEVTQTNATFAERVPSYPGSYEVALAGEFRDAFGFPTRVKTLNAEDPAEKVQGFYERHFERKSYHVYPVRKPMMAVAALDIQKKHGYMVILLPQGKHRTRVFVTFTDYKRKRPGNKARLVPIKIGNRPPMVVSSGDDKNEMAVYLVEGTANEVFRTCGAQLEQEGWQLVQLPKKLDVPGKVIKEHRVYVREGMELAISARSGGNGKTVLMCMIYPRMG